MLFPVFVSLLCLSQALGQSVKSCGGSGDVLSNAVFSISPDPVQKGSPLTITATGKLTAAFTGGSAKLDLDVKALGIINEPISMVEKFSFEPAFAPGDVKVVLGPFTLPKLPGKVAVSGTVKLIDGRGKQVACVALDLSLIDAVEAADLVTSRNVYDSNATTVGGTKNCGTSSDHFKDVSITDDGNGTTISGNLDEEIPSGSFDINLQVKVSFIKVPIVCKIPFTVSPALPKGAYKLVAANPPAGLKSGVKVTVSGDVKMDDQNSEEVLCLHTESP